MLFDLSLPGHYSQLNNRRSLSGYMPISGAYGDPDFGDIAHEQKWAELNALGTETDRYLRTSCALSIISNAGSSVIGDENPIFKGVKYFLDSGKELFSGLRDYLMYLFYGRSVRAVDDGDLKYSDYSNHALVQRVQGIIDDGCEDAMTDKLNAVQNGWGPKSNGTYGNCSTLWRWATKSTRWKLFSAPFIPLLNLVHNGFGSALAFGLDWSASTLWRTRFLRSFELSAPDRIPKLLYHGALSLFNSDHKSTFDKLCDQVIEPSTKYLKEQYGEGYNTSGKSGLALYVESFFARTREHLDGVLDPSREIEKKIARGDLEYTDDENANLTNGLGNPNSEANKRQQRLSSLTDLVGPIVGSLGIIINSTFEPLRIFMNIFGIETGKKFVTAISSTKIFLSNLRYLPMLVLPLADSERAVQDQINQIPDQSSPTVQYLKRLKRGYASLFFEGLAGVGLSAAMPFLHMFKGDPEENKFGDFIINSLNSYNNIFIPLLFSARRGLRGQSMAINAHCDSVGKEAHEMTVDDLHHIHTESTESRNEIVDYLGKSELPGIDVVRGLAQQVVVKPFLPKYSEGNSGETTYKNAA